MAPADPPQPDAPVAPVAPVAPAPAPASEDSIKKGVGWALLWQLGAIVLSAPLFFSVWGVIQWFALVPLFIRWRRRGFPLAARGVLIVGFVGMLLNGTCAYLVLGNMSFR